MVRREMAMRILRHGMVAREPVRRCVTVPTIFVPGATSTEVGPSIVSILGRTSPLSASRAEAGKAVVAQSAAL